MFRVKPKPLTRRCKGEAKVLSVLCASSKAGGKTRRSVERGSF